MSRIIHKETKVYEYEVSNKDISAKDIEHGLMLNEYAVRKKLTSNSAELWKVDDGEFVEKVSDLKLIEAEPVIKSYTESWA